MRDRKARNFRWPSHSVRKRTYSPCRVRHSSQGSREITLTLSLAVQPSVRAEIDPPKLALASVVLDMRSDRTMPYSGYSSCFVVVPGSGRMSLAMG